jgi:phytoene dehydrogenase-like protein
MTKSIIIIGAGIAGLSAGCYAQMNGYDSSIYEKHSISGGLCTSWTRGQYTFDGSIDWLTGSAPDGMFYPLWQEAGAIKGKRFFYYDEYCRYYSENGRIVTLYTDPDRLENELKGHAPEDKAAIEELCRIIRVFKDFKAPVSKAVETMGFADGMKMMADMFKHMKAYRYFLKYGKISMAEFASGFKSPLLKDLLTSIWNNDIPVYMFAGVLAWCSNGTAGYPEGGSLKLAQAIEKRYERLGGKIYFGQRVEKILADNGKAVGIKLADGSERHADIVISAADCYTVLNSMLDGRYTPDAIKEWYKDNAAFAPYIQVSLGVSRDMIGEPRLIYARLKKPLVIAGKDVSYMILHNYAFDQTLAPKGKTALAVRFFTEYGYWERLYKDKVKYKEEKKALEEAVIRELDGLYPGLAAQVEASDVATPITYFRYTGTWKGAAMGWMATTENFGKNLPKTLPGLKDFYMTGQWITPGGGVPIALKTARDALQIICRKDGKRFITTKDV